MKKILFCFGTRPEIIKMAPIIIEAENSGFTAEVCLTGQHKEMIKPFLNFFNIKENYSLDIMKENQTLASLNAAILNQMDQIIDKSNPDFIAVQGDTTSTFACALAGFFKKVLILHIEAGLRTNNIYSPFPEEVNRQMISTFASFNFCPTEHSKNNLLEEKRKNIFVTGNTSIDSLRITLDTIEKNNLNNELLNKYSKIDFTKKIILVTCHRRENHGAPIKNICDAILDIAVSENCEIILPVHLNPNVKNIIENKLGSTGNIHLLSPLDYVDFTWIMSKAFLILTDSGGVQEEAPYFKKPILVLRENTERQEIIDIGAGKLVGSNKDLIISEVSKCFKDSDYYNSFLKDESPFGNGHASREIIKVIKG